MANLTIVIPDAQVNRVLNAFADSLGWTGTDPQGNPENKQQFLKRRVILYIKGVTFGREQQAQMQALVPPSDVDLA